MKKPPPLFPFWLQEHWDELLKEYPHSVENPLVWGDFREWAEKKFLSLEKP